MFEQHTLEPVRTRPGGYAARPMRATLPVLLLFAFACRGPDAVEPERRAGQVEASRAVAATGGDVRGIEQLVEEFESAFSAKDAVAYGDAYTENADFVNPVGAVTTGRAALVAQHAMLFAGPLAPATFTAELRDVDFLTGTSAVADVFTTLSGFAGPPPPFTVVSPDGAVRSRTRWVVEKRGGEWEIVIAYHRGWWSL